MSCQSDGPIPTTTLLPQSHQCIATFCNHNVAHCNQSLSKMMPHCCQGVATLLQHCCHLVLTVYWHYWYIVAILLPHCCHLVIRVLSYCYHTVATLQLCWMIVVSDIDECAAFGAWDPCANIVNGEPNSCTNQIGGYTCNCTTGHHKDVNGDCGDREC